jgi:hypothetical protein
MSYRRTRTIAGLRFELTSRGDLEDPDPRSPAAGFYVGDPATPADPHETCVPVEIIPVTEVSIPASAPAFDGGSWWSWRSASGFTFSNGRDASASWLAELDVREPRLAVRVVCPSRRAGGAQAERPRNPFVYPLDQIVLYHLLPFGGGVLLHGAGMVLKGRGVVCPGKSGAGKTTLSRLVAPAGLHVLSDDRAVVRRWGGPFHVFGTPWPGDAKIAVNEHAPLRALLFLVQAAAHRIVPIQPNTAFRHLAPTCSVPWYDAEMTGLSMAVIEDVLRESELNELHFARDPGVAELLVAWASVPAAASG